MHYKKNHQKEQLNCETFNSIFSTLNDGLLKFHSDYVFGHKFIDFKFFIEYHSDLLLLVKYYRLHDINIPNMQSDLS